jgi:hypothetical protein
METLQTLGTALGLTALAGLNLYFTVFFTGLAIHLGWVQLAPGLEGLHALADPVVLTVAGGLLALELIVDKCAYADSGWDAIHTAIRPLGGAIIGLKALGTIDPSLEIIGVLLGGSIAFTTHAAKAGTRLVVNTSPETLTNVGVSLAENALVATGLWFVFAHPVWTLVILTIFVAGFWYCFPKFYRLARAHTVALWHRLRPQSAGNQVLPGFAVEPWLALQHRDEKLAWALPCFTGAGGGLGRFVRGCLVATTDRRLFFIGKKNFRRRVRLLPLTNARWHWEPGRLYSRLTLQTAEGEVVRWRFTRRFSPHLPAAVAWLQSESAPVTPAQIGAGI